jgi:Flp pilus assembly protein TadG
MTRLSLRSKLARFRRDQHGTAVVETAIIAPVLALLALGTYDLSQMVARQHDLQGGATDLEGIILAVANGQATNVQTISDVLANTLELQPDQVEVVKKFRCGTTETLVDLSSDCEVDEEIATYVQVTLTDTYAPTWTKFGVGGDLDYNFVRTIQVS